MKRVVAFLLAAIMAVMLSGCSILVPTAIGVIEEVKEKIADKSVSSSRASSEPAVSSREESSRADSGKQKLKDFGSDKLGYVKLPDNWSVDATFNDETDFARYTEGNNAVMMWIYENSEKSAKEYASTMVSEAEKEGGFNIETEWVTLAGYDAYLLRCSYPNQIGLYDWVFETEDGTVHFVAAQTDEADITTLAALVESTYTFPAANVGGTESKGNSSEKAIANTQRIGNSAAGYMDIPNDWISFGSKDEYGDLLSYFSSDFQTMLTVMMLGLSAKNYADESYATAKKEGKAELTEVKMDGYTAYRLSEKKTGEVSTTVTWVIDLDGEHMVVILLAGATDDVVQLIEQSYSIKK